MQRRSPGWVIGAWFVPYLNFRWPFQIVADIWRAGLPSAEREKPAVLPGAWWACWLVAGFTAYLGTVKARPQTRPLPDGSPAQVALHSDAGLSLISPIFAAVAAVLLMIVVITITKRQQEQAALTAS